MGAGTPASGRLEMLRAKMRQQVEHFLQLPDAPEVVEALATAAAGWIVIQEDPPLGVPVPESMYDDVAQGFVEHYLRGTHAPPATKAQFRAKARLLVDSTLEQLHVEAVSAAQRDALVWVAFGHWKDGEPAYLLGVYAREVVGYFRRGRG